MTIVVADVAGKGMGASLIMASVKAVLPFLAREPLGEAMRLLNGKLVAELGKREFVALVCARYAPATRALEVANAGCPDPYLVRGSGGQAMDLPVPGGQEARTDRSVCSPLRAASVEPIVVSGTRLPLGLRESARYDAVTLRLDAGDRVLFLSDGIPEAPRANGEPLGYEETARLAGETRGDLDAFLAAVRARVDQRLADDWTALVLDVTTST